MEARLQSYRDDESLVETWRSKLGNLARPDERRRKKMDASKVSRRSLPQEAANVTESWAQDKSAPHMIEPVELARVVSIYAESGTDRFQCERRCCVDSKSEVNAYLLGQNMPDGVGYVRPQLSLFVFDCGSEGSHEMVQISEDGYWVPKSDLRQSAATEANQMLGIPSYPSKDAVTFAKHPRWLDAPAMTSTHFDTVSYSISTIDCTLAWIYSKSTGTTIGTLTCVDSHTANKAESFVNSLVAHQFLARHPMLLALLLQAQIASDNEKWFEIHVEGIIKAAEITGYHHHLSMERRADDSYDPAVETAKLGGITANLATNRHCWQGLQELALFGLEELEAHRDAPTNAPAESWQKGCYYIEQHTICLGQQAKGFCQEADSWQHKATLQIQGFFNIIAQRDQELSRKLAFDSLRLTEVSLQLGRDSQQIAEDVKRDSTSMKAIAAVTMLYLPGTFAASLLAIPVFRWDAPSASGVVNPRIWIYWIATLPLTLLTLSLFWLWGHFMNRPKVTTSTYMKHVKDEDGPGVLSSYSNTGAKTQRDSGQTLSAPRDENQKYRKGSSAPAAAQSGSNNDPPSTSAPRPTTVLGRLRRKQDQLKFNNTALAIPCAETVQHSRHKSDNAICSKVPGGSVAKTACADTIPADSPVISITHSTLALPAVKQVLRANQTSNMSDDFRGTRSFDTDINEPENSGMPENADSKSFFDKSGTSDAPPARMKQDPSWQQFPSETLLVKDPIQVGKYNLLLSSAFDMPNRPNTAVHAEASRNNARRGNEHTYRDYAQVAARIAITSRGADVPCPTLDKKAAPLQTTAGSRIDLTSHYPEAFDNADLVARGKDALIDHQMNVVLLAQRDRKLVMMAQQEAEWQRELKDHSTLPPTISLTLNNQPHFRREFSLSTTSLALDDQSHV